MHATIAPPKEKDELSSKYDITETLLGEGSYGKVYAATDKTTGKRVAIKKIKKLSEDPDEITQILREITFLRMLKDHPHIISLEYIAMSDAKETGTWSPFDDLSLVFERYDTDLANLISSEQDYTLGHVRLFLFQILSGVHYIHSAKLIHRDLKPSNILLNRKGCGIKICDFGLARSTHDMRETIRSETSDEPAPPRLYRQLTKYVVSRWYRSPEVILRCSGRGGSALDMWSVGCILAELILRYPIFPGDSSIKVLELIFACTGTPEPNDREWVDSESAIHYLREKPPVIPSQSYKAKFKGLEPTMLELLERLLELNPAKRITSEQALQPYFFPKLSLEYRQRHVLAFPLESRTVGQKRPFDEYCEYYELEAELEIKKLESEQIESEQIESEQIESEQIEDCSLRIIQKALKLIQKECERYTPPSVATVATTSSYITNNLFHPVTNQNPDASSVIAQVNHDVTTTGKPER